MSDDEAKITTESFINKFVKADKIYDNLGQEVIMTTEDKARICLLEHLRYLEKRRGWSTPLAILLTVIVTIVTTEFKDVGFGASTWQAIFVIAGIIAAIWLGFSVIKIPKSITIEDVINKLKIPKSK